jgi:hypothetical protein
MSTEEQRLAEAAADEAFDLDDLTERMAKLSSKKRRETLYLLSGEFTSDVGEYSSLSSTEQKVKSDPNVTAKVQNQVFIDNFERKLPRFSAKIPVPNGEVPFKKWKVAAERLVQNQEISESKIKEYIFRSLIGTPDDIIEQYRSCSAKDIISVLNKNYGSVVDGEELLLGFYQMNQASGQKASDYLTGLFVALSEVVEYDGLPKSLVNRTLLKQFLRGTTDEEIVLKLRLYETVDIKPPPYDDLIALIRREEQLRYGKKLRLKLPARSQAAVVEAPKVSTELEECRKKVAELEAKLQEHTILMQQTTKQMNDKVRKPFFCYRCGKDFHRATTCVNSPNEELVKQKITEKYGNNSKN